MSVVSMVLNSRDPLLWRELVVSGHDDVCIFHGADICRTLDEDLHHFWLSNLEPAGQVRHFWFWILGAVVSCLVVMIIVILGGFVWCIYRYSSPLSHWRCGSHIVPVLIWPWRIWVEYCAIKHNKRTYVDFKVLSAVCEHCSRNSMSKHL